MKTGVLIVAAGRGSRFGDDGPPKQYRDLAGRMVLTRTLEAFATVSGLEQIQVVINSDDRHLYDAAVQDVAVGLLPPVAGGDTRQASVRAGLDALADHDAALTHVLIHDAARPFVAREAVERLLDALRGAPSALLASPLVDTIKRVAPSSEAMAPQVQETVPREGLWAAQTPQGFKLTVIRELHRRACGEQAPAFTDDAALCEWAGIPVTLVEGDPGNTKLTTKRDFARAEERMHMNVRSAQSVGPDVRVGQGFDVHRLGPGDHVMLSGVRVPFDRALIGHSDGDVALHALTDAVLATIGEKDIGAHFPPSDPEWRGASSDRFLAHAVGLLESAGGTLTLLDLTIICEAPKIGPHREEMRRRIGEIAGIDPSRVSVKATTSEGLGFTGRGEGIAAMASATATF